MIDLMAQWLILKTILRSVLYRYLNGTDRRDEVHELRDTKEKGRGWPAEALGSVSSSRTKM